MWSAVSRDRQHDLVADLLEPLPRVALVPAVQAVLGVTSEDARRIVEAFDEYVAQPLEVNLARMCAGATSPSATR